MSEPSPASARWLPRVGSVGYFLLLGGVSLLLVGPLCGVAAAYMNFAIGAFIEGQVFAGILGSIVTLGYGPEGKHGANYVQTAAASIGAMAAMGVLVQAMVWLEMPLPPPWLLCLYFLCLGMFSVGLGMLYTPLLVDRMKLTYPGGLAVANILRALTDPRILRRSVATLGGGIFSGVALGWLSAAAPAVAAMRFEGATVGGAMIVGARVTLPAAIVGAIGAAATPWLRAHGHLGADEPFRRIAYLIALGAVLGAAVLDLGLLAREAALRTRGTRPLVPKANAANSESRGARRVVLWVVFWAAALLIVGTKVLGSVGWIALAIVISVFFQLINGIQMGMTGGNPISSAFIVSVLLMAGLGLRDPRVGLVAGSVLLVSCTLGLDMQQGRSIGWRLGSSRALQFRFQAAGIVVGAICAVFLPRLFLDAFPVLEENQLLHPELRHGAAHNWQSAMTYKIVGVLSTLGENQAKTYRLIAVGLMIGFAINALRHVVLRRPNYAAWKRESRAGASVDFFLDAVLLASPYAAGFGCFVELPTALWWGAGGVVSSTVNWLLARRHRARVTAAGGSLQDEALPADMSSTSLAGGGLAAGTSLYILYVAIRTLVTTGALAKLFGG